MKGCGKLIDQSDDGHQHREVRMAFWIFKCSPAQYDLPRRMKDTLNAAISWRVTNYRDQIGPGDTAFIWETGDNRGIRAVMEVDEGPRELAELESEQEYSKTGRDTEIKLRVLGRLVRSDLKTLTHEFLPGVPGLENLAVFRKDVYQQATNFSVTAEEGIILSRLVQAEGG